MSPEKQRIVIAEALGWKTFKGSENYPSPKVWTDPQGMARCWNEIPDYHNDLNAIQEAIFSATFGDSEEVEFHVHLENITEDFYGQIMASAAQRCEAFLKTIGKWEEE